MTTFSLDAYYNEYLPEGGDIVDVIISVSAAGSAAGAASDPGRTSAGAEVIMVDASGSMRGEKMREARRATEAAIDCIQDGVRFAVLAGTDKSVLVYPTEGLVEASAQTRKEGRDAVRQIQAGGGTAIGSWIRTATDLLAEEVGVRHAILLTDGRDEHETADELSAAVAQASGVFQCDCRGVGDEWDVAELRRIANALLGTVDIVADPGNLAADFEAMMREAMGKAVADVSLRVWTPQGARVESLKEVSPDLLDLTASRAAANDLTGDYPTGAWGDEARDYHLAVRVNPGPVGQEMLASRVSMLTGGTPGGQYLVKVAWTDDAALSTRINRQVAYYTGRQELADAIQEGLEARKNGDPDTAVVKLGRAVQLADRAGDSDMANMLAKVVEVEDPATGRVRLRGQVQAEDEMTLDTRSTKTTRVRR
jgi:von Willebrand factor type A C-terminal domain/von Willebrand factor type A domain